jgi:hypothetical protein
MRFRMISCLAAGSFSAKSMLAETPSILTGRISSWCIEVQKGNVNH